jgi:hypothetical protein
MGAEEEAKARTLFASDRGSARCAADLQLSLHFACQAAAAELAEYKVRKRLLSRVGVGRKGLHCKSCLRSRAVA